MATMRLPLVAATALVAIFGSPAFSAEPIDGRKLYDALSNSGQKLGIEVDGTHGGGDSDQHRSKISYTRIARTADTATLDKLIEGFLKEAKQLLTDAGRVVVTLKPDSHQDGRPAWEQSHIEFTSPSGRGTIQVFAHPAPEGATWISYFLFETNGPNSVEKAARPLK